MATLRSDRAAKSFFDLIAPGERWDITHHKAKPLIRAAFALYETEWRRPGQTWSISDWKWPFDQLKTPLPFRENCGDEPWTVLLRRAWEIATTTEGR